MAMPQITHERMIGFGHTWECFTNVANTSRIDSF
jgi:hypothetical protein